MDEEGWSERLVIEELIKARGASTGTRDVMRSRQSTQSSVSVTQTRNDVCSLRILGVAQCIGEGFDRGRPLIMGMAERPAIKRGDDADLRGVGKIERYVAGDMVCSNHFSQGLLDRQHSARSGLLRCVHGTDGHLRGESDSVSGPWRA